MLANKASFVNTLSVWIGLKWLVSVWTSRRTVNELMNDTKSIHNKQKLIKKNLQAVQNDDNDNHEFEQHMINQSLFIRFLDLYIFSLFLVKCTTNFRVCLASILVFALCTCIFSMRIHEKSMQGNYNAYFWRYKSMHAYAYAYFMHMRTLCIWVLTHKYASCVFMQKYAQLSRNTLRPTRQ